MNDRFKWFLSGAWLLASALLLVFPVFVPSYPSPSGIPLDPISLSTTAMFVLSFPASVFSLLLSPVASLIFGIDPNSITGLYLNIKILFVLGLAQWFWVVPRLLRRRRAAQISEVAALPQYVPPVDLEAFDSGSRTPVERVFDDEK